jgi:hypothetical protein
MPQCSANMHSRILADITSCILAYITHNYTYLSEVFRRAYLWHFEEAALQIYVYVCKYVYVHDARGAFGNFKAAALHIYVCMHLRMYDV